MKPFTRSVELTNEELVVLDGRVRPDVQIIIEDAKSALKLTAIGDSTLAEIVRSAAKVGILNRRNRSIGTCKGCGATTTYGKIQRGQRRGQTDWKRPSKVYGTSFLDGCIIVENYALFGYCSICAGDVTKRLEQFILDHDLPIEIDPEQTNWVRESQYRCRGCEQDMWQFDMSLGRAIMGDGYYHAGCPHCGTKSQLFTHHDTTGEWRMVRRATLAKATPGGCWQRSK